METPLKQAEPFVLSVSIEKVHKYMYLPLLIDTNEFSGKMSVTVQFWNRYIRENVLHPDYCFRELAQKQNISEEHQNNILAIISNMIEFGWNSALNLTYNDLSKDNLEPDFVNLDGEILGHLEVIYNLLITRENYINESEILVNPKSFMDANSSKSSLVKENQVRIKHDNYLKKGLIDYTIKYHFDQLSLPIYDYVHHGLPDFVDLTISNIGELMSSFIPSITEEELKHRFIKDICDTVLRYIKEQAGFDIPGINLSKEQGEIIYSLLLLFNMITLSQHKRHDNPKKKSDYIATFFKPDEMSQKRTFLKLNH